MALGELLGLRQPKTSGPFDILEGEEFERDLRKRRGGLQSNRPEDRTQIEELKKSISLGALTEEQIQAKIHRNPGAASELMAAAQMPERQIGQQFFSPGRPEKRIPPTEVIPGQEAEGPPQIIPGQAPKADFQGAVMEALNRGRFDLAKKIIDFAERPDKQQKQEQRLTEVQFKQAQQLRGEHTKLSKRFIDVRDSFGRILESATDPSAAGDLSLIFNYMKMLDPESVVRESEFATAENSASVPERVRARYNKVVSGERLSQNQRADFFDRAKRLHDRQLKTQRDVDKRFTGLSKRFGIPSDLVVQDFALKDVEKVKPVAPQTDDLTEEERRELDALRRSQQ